MTKRYLTRRDFLKLAGLTTLGAVSACASALTLTRDDIESIVMHHQGVAYPLKYEVGGNGGVYKPTMDITLPFAVDKQSITLEVSLKREFNPTFAPTAQARALAPNPLDTTTGVQNIRSEDYGVSGDLILVKPQFNGDILYDVVLEDKAAKTNLGLTIQLNQQAKPIEIQDARTYFERDKDKNLVLKFESGQISYDTKRAQFYEKNEKIDLSVFANVMQGDAIVQSNVKLEYDSNKGGMYFNIDPSKINKDNGGLDVQLVGKAEGRDVVFLGQDSPKLGNPLETIVLGQFNVKREGFDIRGNTVKLNYLGDIKELEKYCNCSRKRCVM